LKESKRSWRLGSRRAVLNPAHKPKKGGSRFGFSLAQAGTVTIRFTRRVHRHNKASGVLTIAAPQGRDLLYFFGRLSKHRALRPGHYVASLSIANTAGVSAPHALRFTVRAH
jgi:hypothetical protein